MKQLNVELEHCYGIKKLSTKFDFSTKRAFAIYAPNGAMKSSFAKTFQDIAKKEKSSDKMFPTRVTKRSVIDETGKEVPPENILVVQPYDEVFGHSAKTSTLLVNATLRVEYEKLHVDFEAAKDILLKALKSQSGSKRDLEKEISSTITRVDNQFYKALIRIEEELKAQKDAPFADVKYDIIFDEKVVAFLGTKDVKSVLEDYIKKYNELLAASTYFKKGVFTYYNAGSIAKSLAENGFFKAKHSINLNSGERLEISTPEELDALVAKEKAAISTDATLRKRFAELEKLITKNATVRDFDEYLSQNEGLLPHLANIDQFREEVWKSYLKQHYALYEDVVAKYRLAEARRAEIEKLAAGERTQWEQVIEIFNDRFYVPFTLVPKNRTEVILGQEPVLSLGFTFKEGVDVATVERDDLLAILSTGEKKALYVLNIIFEIQARIQSGVETLMIVDDIADSFDYKNKYAIIQYLKDVSETPNFAQVILTHNFDFFRTVKGRFVGYGNCLMVSKNSTGVTLTKAIGIDNVFVNDWKHGFSTNDKKRIACIPFMRNLVEFTKGESDPEFLLLTSLLHWKPASPSLDHLRLFASYNGIFGTALTAENGATKVVDEIFSVADKCLTEPEAVNFENKIVLSIAIRLRAEKFMVEKINDAAATNGIVSNQTGALLRMFKTKYSDPATLSTLDRVTLMTPENIHLNAFMYEPIMDMSDEHLKRLYSDVSALS